MMKVSWDDIDRSHKAGTYFVEGNSLTVRDEDIEAWSAHPKAVFDTIWFKHPEESAGSHRLVTWEPSTT